jgi:DivIVA domain-containing protein
MALVLVVAALVVVVVVAFLMAGTDGRLPPADHDRVPADLPEDRPATRADLDRLRFATEFRGYRMDQVDAVLDQVAADLDQQREEVDGLRQQLLAAGIEPSAVHDAVPISDPNMHADVDPSGSTAQVPDAAAERDA